MLKIITDSASGPDGEVIRRYQLHVIPTLVVIDEVDYLGSANHPFQGILQYWMIPARCETYHQPGMFEEAFTPMPKSGTV